MKRATAPVDLDDVAVGIEQEKLRVTGGAVAADDDAHRVVLHRVFPKTASSQLGEGAVEIIGAEGKMAIVIVDVAGPEGARRIDNQMHLQVAAGEPGAGDLKRRPFNGRETKQLLIERDRPRKIGDDDRNMVEGMSP